MERPGFFDQKESAIAASIRLLIMEDDREVLLGLRMLLGLTGDISIAGDSSDGDSALQMALEKQPDVVLLDALAADTPDELAELVKHIEDTIPNVLTLVLDRTLNMDTLRACVKARANGYLLRDERRILIAWAIVWAQAHDFIVTQSVKDALKDEFEDRLFRARVVPDRRTYPELTERIRQALQLCVVEGMSAELAADAVERALRLFLLGVCFAADNAEPPRAA